ncbi:hypothetical protein ACL07V_06910 [Streptomyces sp. MB22_4]|uniref:hypothetical protein n=1 Tax=Streptomyces sp. MB22_4 TaxID=3383120 RepID=UPI0039A3107A
MERHVRVLSQEQLEEDVVDAHDLPGIRVTAIGTGARGLGSDVVRADRGTDTAPSSCAPVSAVLNGASEYTPVGSVVRVAGRKGHSAILTLVSYRPADAARAIGELRTALRTCVGFTRDAMNVTCEDIEVTDAPAQGDEGVAFRFATVMGSGTDSLRIPTSVAAVRHGSTVAVYKAISDVPGKPADIPGDLVDAQSKVLDAAVRAAPVSG